MTLVCKPALMAMSPIGSDDSRSRLLAFSIRVVPLQRLVQREPLGRFKSPQEIFGERPQSLAPSARRRSLLQFFLAALLRDAPGAAPSDLWKSTRAARSAVGLNEMRADRERHIVHAQRTASGGPPKTQ